MSLELQTLLKKVSHMDLSLLAGEKGLHHPVSWVHIVETPEASNYLLGGEIAFTTGIAIEHNHQLLTLIEQIYNSDGTGVIVNLGPFIESIPKNCIDFCNEYNFPLLTVPWKVHLVEIMRIFSSAITLEDQRSVRISSAFKNAISFPIQEELYLIPLAQSNFSMNWTYAAGVLQLEGITISDTSLSENLAMALEHHLKFLHPTIAVFPHEAHILLIFANMSEEALRNCIKEIRLFLPQCLDANQKYSLGIGRQTKSLRCLYKSYQQALAIEKLHEHKKIDPLLNFYSDMGLYRLLLGIEDREIMEEYQYDLLHPLYEYDEANHSDLMDVLTSYLSHNGSVKEASAELFIHRNTVNYKLHKIEELLSLDLSTLDTRMELVLALKLKDMM